MLFISAVNSELGGLFSTGAEKMFKEQNGKEGVASGNGFVWIQ